MGKKECTLCGKMLSLSEFSRCSHGRYGRYCRCKKCQALVGRIRRGRKSGRERIRESQSEWRRRNRGVAAASAQRWKERHPERVRAQYAVRAGVLGGLLVRPERCEGCGKEKKVVAHHGDYARPLEVEWLCGRCHAVRHVDQRLNRGTRAA